MLLNPAARQDFIDYAKEEDLWWFMLCPSEYAAEVYDDVQDENFILLTCNDFLHEPKYLWPLAGGVVYLPCSTLPEVEINEGPDLWGVDYGFDEDFLNDAFNIYDVGIGAGPAGVDIKGFISIEVDSQQLLTLTDGLGIEHKYGKPGNTVFDA